MTHARASALVVTTAAAIAWTLACQAGPAAYDVADDGSRDAACADGPSRPFRPSGSCPGFAGTIAGPFTARGAFVDCVSADSLKPGDPCVSRVLDGPAGRPDDAKRATLCSVLYGDACGGRRCELGTCAADFVFGAVPAVQCLAGDRGICSESNLECICGFTLQAEQDLFCGCDCDV